VILQRSQRALHLEVSASVLQPTPRRQMFSWGRGGGCFSPSDQRSALCLLPENVGQGEERRKKNEGGRLFSEASFAGWSGCKRSATEQHIWSWQGFTVLLKDTLAVQMLVNLDVRSGHLLEDCQLFVTEILQDEDLSESAQEARRVLLNNFRVVHVRNPQEFPFPADYRDDDGSDDNRSSSLGRSAQSDDASLASDNQDDGALESWRAALLQQALQTNELLLFTDFDDIPLVAVQDLSNILKQGYLEKKRRDHSFFGSEWQKRWCVLNNSIFYYFGSEKDKQQKGSFYINDYNVKLVPNLRKDSKKNACFELSAPGLRAFQFTASSPQEAREWVKQISFVLTDLRSASIPCDDDEDVEEEDEETYDDIEGLSGPPPPWPGAAVASQSGKQGGRQDTGEVDEEDEDIYEVLPEEDFPDPADESSEKSNKQAWSSDYANYYQGLWDCQADEPDELDFRRGDLIYIISKVHDGGVTHITRCLYPASNQPRLTFSPLQARVAVNPSSGREHEQWAYQNATISQPPE
ncbi:hypothetical protein L3Q82_010558, partial [Scortum barcoo]